MIKAMKDFQIPMRVEVDKDTLSPTFGRFTTEAFERGFGTTVGNSLRRELLPPSLRKYAQLDKKLVLVGQGKKFELWSEDNWQQCLETAVSGDFELPDAIATISF